MAEFQEEVYIIEKQEISDDEEDQEYERLMKQDQDIEEDINADLDLDEDSDDDLEDFNKLKLRQEEKAVKQMQKTGVSSLQKSSMMQSKQPTATSVERPVVVDDFIRNFLTKCTLNKTMNIFQQEWFELQKKGTFQDLGIGLITDITNKNAKLEVKINKMRTELDSAKVIAEEAKSTWEKLRKERDYHKTH